MDCFLRAYSCTCATFNTYISIYCIRSSLRNCFNWTFTNTWTASNTFFTNLISHFLFFIRLNIANVNHFSDIKPFLAKNKFLIIIFVFPPHFQELPMFLFPRILLWLVYNPAANGVWKVLLLHKITFVGMRIFVSLGISNVLHQLRRRISQMQWHR